MRYVREDTEKLSRQFAELKAKVQQFGKWHFKHGHSDSAHLWTILYNYLDEIATRTKRNYISEPIFEIALYPSKHHFSIQTHKSGYTCFRGYIAQSSDYDKIISDLTEMLFKYGLELTETEASQKRQKQKNVVERPREYVVKFVEEKK
ncbi:MAG: hypothetical protein IJW20_03780 [Clostridia bacterium]|nr:hypothetical protein [Clostridia bacterium]